MCDHIKEATAGHHAETEGVLGTNMLQRTQQSAPSLSLLLVPIPSWPHTQKSNYIMTSSISGSQYELAYDKPLFARVF